MAAAGRLEVGFAAGDWQRWLGGVNYYRALLSAVTEDPESRVEPILFMGRGGSDALEGFPEVRRVESPIFDRGAPAWFARAAGRRLLDRDPLFDRLLDRHGVRVISHLNQPWQSRRRAMLGWIPDLQHFRLPENFSPRDRAARDRQFRQIVQLSTFVIVSSEASRRDLEEYAPAAAEKARVLHFVPQVPDVERLPPREELAARYAIEEPYLHLPNQFWAHKNHGLVIESLALLGRRGGAPMVIATGAPTGSGGDSDHHDALMARVRELGLESRFRSLGIVPYPDMIGLMVGSIAVINPSRFEGWSTTVEEAKALGKPILCSDLDVHREQLEEDQGALFDPDSPGALADLIQERLAEAGDGTALRAGAADRHLARRRQFSREFSEIVSAAEAGLGR